MNVPELVDYSTEIYSHWEQQVVLSPYMRRMLYPIGASANSVNRYLLVVIVAVILVHFLLSAYDIDIEDIDSHYSPKSAPNIASEKVDGSKKYEHHRLYR